MTSPGVVENHEQNSRGALGQAQRLDDFRRPGSGEDVAHDAVVEHARAHKAAQRGFVPGAAQRHDGDAVGRLRLGAANDLLRLNPDKVAMSDGKPFEQFRREVPRVVDKFLHSHVIS